MGRGFKEIAHLRGNTKLFEDNFAKIDWSNNDNDKRTFASRQIEKSENGEEVAIERRLGDEFSDIENSFQDKEKLLLEKAKKLARESFREVEQNQECFIDSPSWIFGFIEGYKKALENE